MSELKRTELSVRRERAVLVGVILPGSTADPRDPLGELAALAKTAGASVVGQVLQKRQKPDSGTYIGTGKAFEIARLANQREVEIAELGVTPQHVVELNGLIDVGKINDKLAKKVLAHVLEGEGSPAEVVERRGLAVVSDDSVLTAAIDDAMAQMPDVVAKVQAGKVQAVGALIGPVMKATRGQADAKRVRELVLEKLGVQG